MAFNLGELKTAFVAEGKKVLKPTIEVVKSFGTISITDRSFAGRRVGDFGEYIMVRDNGTQEIMIVSLAKGTPASSNAFEIKQLRALETYEDMHEGDVFFKAYGIVTEVEA